MSFADDVIKNLRIKKDIETKVKESFDKVKTEIEAALRQADDLKGFSLGKGKNVYDNRIHDFEVYGIDVVVSVDDVLSKLAKNTILPEEATAENIKKIVEDIILKQIQVPSCTNNW